MPIHDITLGEKIKFYRHRGKMSQFELEIETDMPTGAVCRIERGCVNPSKETMLKIANALKLSPYEIADLFEIDIPEVNSVRTFNFSTLHS